MDHDRETQLTFERAAALHERAAAFWDRKGRPDKAAVEREKAELNRAQARPEWIRRVQLPGNP